MSAPSSAKLLSLRLLVAWIVLSLLGYGTMAHMDIHSLDSDAPADSALVYAMGQGGQLDDGGLHSEEGQGSGIDSSCCHCCHGAAHLLGLARLLHLGFPRQRVLLPLQPQAPFSSRISAPLLRPPIV